MMVPFLAGVLVGAAVLCAALPIIFRSRPDAPRLAPPTTPADAATRVYVVGNRPERDRWARPPIDEPS